MTLDVTPVPPPMPTPVRCGAVRQFTQKLRLPQARAFHLSGVLLGLDRRVKVEVMRAEMRRGGDWFARTSEERMINARKFSDRSYRPLQSQIGPVEALLRAAEYRRMAATATTGEVRAALLRLAQRYEGLAECGRVPIAPDA